MNDSTLIRHRGWRRSTSLWEARPPVRRSSRVLPRVLPQLVQIGTEWDSMEHSALIKSAIYQ